MIKLASSTIHYAMIQRASFLSCYDTLNGMERLGCNNDPWPFLDDQRKRRVGPPAPEIQEEEEEEEEDDGREKGAAGRGQ